MNDDNFEKDLIWISARIINEFNIVVWRKCKGVIVNFYTKFLDASILKIWYSQVSKFPSDLQDHISSYYTSNYVDLISELPINPIRLQHVLNLCLDLNQKVISLPFII